jgi:DNA-directed RNA polymerase specialized sigma24 family protein
MSVLGDLLRFHGVENGELLDALDWKYRRIEDERAKLRAENDRLRELFKKYINHVSAEEGIPFMPSEYDGFSAEEVATLAALDVEAAALAKEAGK